MFISVIIPVRDGARTIAGCLGGLSEMDFPANRLEVIVVDNGSRDNTRELVAGLGVTCHQEARPGASAARNLGAQKARGEILAFLDADCLADSRWAREIADTFRDPEVQAVVGARDGQCRTWVDRMQHLEYQRFWRQETGPGARLAKLCGSNFAARRDAFLERGGFDEAFAVFEDIELGFRYDRDGARIDFNPRMRVKHVYTDDLATRRKKMFRHGYCEYLVFRKHRDHPRIRSLMPAFFRWYFRALDQGSARALAAPAVLAARMAGRLLSPVAPLLPFTPLRYQVYKTAMNLTLLAGKLTAVRDLRQPQGADPPCP